MSSRDHPPAQHRLRIGRQSVPGRCYFITMDCDANGPKLEDEACRALVQQAVHGMLGRGACRLDAYVVMPAHLHMMFVLDEKKSLSDAIESLKKYSARRVNKLLGRKGAFWQRAFHDHAIRSGKDYAVHLDYILKNPVRDGLAKQGEQYPYMGWGPWEAEEG